MSADLASNPGSSMPVSDPVVQPGGLSQVERVVDTFVSPSKTFTDIRRSASWWLPFVLLLLGGISLAFVTDRQVGYERVSENMIHQSPKLEDRVSSMTPEQRAQQLRVMTISNRATGYAAPLIVLIFFAIYALILWGSFNFGLGAKTTYWQVFAVAFYAALPFLFIDVIAILMLYLGGNADAFDMKNPAGTNLGYFLTDTSPWLHALLTQIDVVRLWSVALTAVGMAIVARKTIAQSAAIVVGLWVLGLLFTVGLTAAFS
jgi:hypothetical protein